MLLAAEIVHALPGRIRFRLDGPALSDGLCDSLHLFLSSQPGIKEVRLNPACGSLLLKYDGGIWSGHRLHKLISAIDPQQLEHDRSKISARANGSHDSASPLLNLLLSTAAF